MRRLNRFENHGFVIEFRGEKEVVVTDKATGEVMKANGDLAKTMKEACIAPNRSQEIPRTVKELRQHKDIDDEHAVLLADGYESVYRDMAGANGTAHLYCADDSHWVVLCEPKDGDIFTMGFDGRDKAIHAAHEFAGKAE